MLHPLVVGEDDLDGVGVHLAQVGGDKFHGDPPALTDVQGVFDVGVVGLHPQDAGGQGPVGAVALVGLGKGAVQVEHRLADVLAEHAGGPADAQGPRRV